MTTMTQPFALRHHHPAITALLVVLFWMAAAALVTTAHAELGRRSPEAAAVATFATLIVTAYAYSRLVARQAGVTHALTVGTTWLMLSITAEVVLTTRAGHAWFTLLGSPDRPLLRNVLLFAWIFAPVLFASREPAS
jgi:hypothetical protein